MNLNLTKPLSFIDLETTGINISHDRIVEIAIVKIHADQTIETFSTLVNPGCAIPAETSKIHGIYDKDVADKPLFNQVAKRVIDYLGNSDLAGFNCLHFDVPLLVEEIMRAGLEIDLTECRIIDVQKIFHKMEPRNLGSALKFYCNKIHDNAHRAETDCIATYEVLKAQLELYNEKSYFDEHSGTTNFIKNDMGVLHKFCELQARLDLAGFLSYNNKKEEIYNFGKYKNRKISDIMKQDPGYMEWILSKDFPLYTKKILREIKEKK